MSSLPAEAFRVSRVLSSLALALTAWSSAPAAQLVTAEDPAFALLHRAVPNDAWRWAVELADLDADGDLDAVAASGAPVGPGRLVVYENDGHALFSEWNSFPADVRAMELGDLDRDGDTDVLGVSAASILILENLGRGAFELVEMPHVLQGPSLVSRALALADVERDGDLDAFFVARPGYSGTDVYLRRNGGDASFEPPEILANAPGSNADLAAADLDGDGDVDLAHSGGPGPNGSLALLFNDGGGSFTQGPTLLEKPPPILGLYDQIEAGDVDGNGTVELVFSDQWSLHLFLNRGGAAFTEAPLRLPASALYAFDLELTDVNQDRTPDLLTGYYLLLNDGFGFFKDGAAVLPDGLGAWKAGDLDRDGDMDLFNGDRLALQDARGIFHDSDPQEPYGSWARLADLDGDGDLDAIGLENDGRGVFEEVVGAIPEGVVGADPYFADFDGDGDADALLFYPYPFSPHQVILNSSAGIFELAGAACQPQPPPENFTMEAAVGDVDADGDLDLLLARLAPGFACHTGPCYSPAPNELWLNDGSACFGDASAALPPSRSEGAFAVDFGDLDTDGDLDAMTAALPVSGPGPWASVYLNGGDGSFTDEDPGIPSSFYASWIALGDVDGDADLDAYFSVSTIALNDGAGRFSTLVTGPLGSAGHPKNVWLGDLDRDGDMDAVEGTFSSSLRLYLERTELFLNQGNTSFQRLAFPPIYTANFDIGDVDQDGDLDLYDGSQVFTNLTRSLAWRGHPRIGHPFAMELTGQEHAPFLLVATRARSSPLPTPFGLFQLDLSSGVTFRRSGSLDGEGRATFTFDVPRNAALIGRTSCWQAFIGSRPRLSNLEVVEIGGF